jgi:hypothetical protein
MKVGTNTQGGTVFHHIYFFLSTFFKFQRYGHLKMRFYFNVLEIRYQNIKNLPFNSEDFDTDNQNIRLDNPLSTHPDYYSKFKNKGLHFIHCNARSLLPKISEVRIIAHVPIFGSLHMIQPYLLKSSPPLSHTTHGYFGCHDFLFICLEMGWG